MTYGLSDDDWAFRSSFEAGEYLPERFDHRAHVRLAYIYLVDEDVAGATERMRASLLAFLARHGVNPSKYHETLTGAWILAVRHFMERSSDAPSADAFIDANATLLDSKIMMTHYSAEVLFSDEARARFVEPNLDEIPRHNSR